MAHTYASESPVPAPSHAAGAAAFSRALKTLAVALMSLWHLLREKSGEDKHALGRVGRRDREDALEWMEGRQKRIRTSSNGGGECATLVQKLRGVGLVAGVSGAGWFGGQSNRPVPRVLNRRMY